MFKKGLFLTIIFLLIFSIGGFATDYKYTQESGTGFFVNTSDKSDAIEDTCELRQIINDLGTLLFHSKMDGLYPKDETTGGTLQIPEAGLKFSNAPVNDDIAAYIAGEMTWQTKAELGLDLSLYYLKTEIDTQGEVENIWGDTLMNDLVDDTDPDLGGQLQSGAHSINFTEQVLTSGTAIAWNLGNSNKATLTAAHNFTITITAPSGALNAQLIVTQDGTGTRVMDEVVTQKDEAIATTDVHIDTEIIDLTVDIPTGARIRFKTSAADLPAPLVVDTIYWAIRSSENHIKVATTKALAIAGTAVNLTDAGTGTHTVQQLVKWDSGTLGVLSTVAGSEDILGLTYKTADKQWYAMLSKNFY